MRVLGAREWVGVVNKQTDSAVLGDNLMASEREWDTRKYSERQSPARVWRVSVTVIRVRVWTL